MAAYQYWVLTNPTTPEQQDEFNDWYDNTHVYDAAAGASEAKPSSAG